jgi:hypothetical protein
MMSLKKGILKTFDSDTYTATIQISGSAKAYLEKVNVARNISSGELVTGRKVAVEFFTENNAKEAVIVGVWT